MCRGEMRVWAREVGRGCWVGFGRWVASPFLFEFGVGLDGVAPDRRGGCVVGGGSLLGCGRWKGGLT